MSKSCVLCSQSQEVLSFVSMARAAGKSSRDIAKELGAKYRLDISYSSVGRHLDHEGVMGSSRQVKVLRAKPRGEDLHLQMSFLLQDGLDMFSRHMVLATNTKTSVKDCLETFRCLDVLFNVLEKLYPNCATTCTSSQGESSEIVSRKMMSVLVGQGMSEQDAAGQVLKFGQLLQLAQENGHV